MKLTTVKIERWKVRAETYQWLEENLGPGRIDVQHAWTMSGNKWAAWTGYTVNGVKRDDYRFFEFKDPQEALLFKMAWE